MIFKQGEEKQSLTKATPNAGYGGFRWTVNRLIFRTYGYGCAPQSRTGLSLNR
jgi:hypothetical protein